MTELLLDGIQLLEEGLHHVGKFYPSPSLTLLRLGKLPLTNNNNYNNDDDDNDDN